MRALFQASVPYLSNLLLLVTAIREIARFDWEMRDAWACVLVGHIDGQVLNVCVFVMES